MIIVVNDNSSNKWSSQSALATQQEFASQLYDAEIISIKRKNENEI